VLRPGNKDHNRFGFFLKFFVFIVHFLCSPKENEPKEKALGAGRWGQGLWP
jgi:hypothetical protein